MIGLSGGPGCSEHESLLVLLRARQDSCAKYESPIHFSINILTQEQRKTPKEGRILSKIMKPM